MKKSSLVLGLVTTFTMTSTAAFADLALPELRVPFAIPEPGTFGLVAGAALAMIIVARFRRRK